MNAQPPRWSRWLWNGPRIDVAISRGSAFARGSLFNVWSRGLSLRLHGETPEDFEPGCDVRLEIPLPTGQGCVAVEARIRRRGTGDFERFLTLEWSDSIFLLDPTHEALVAELVLLNLHSRSHAAAPPRPAG